MANWQDMYREIVIDILWASMESNGDELNTKEEYIEFGRKVEEYVDRLDRLHDMGVDYKPKEGERIPF
jgi:hypothetical protein